MRYDNEEWCKIWNRIDLPFQNWHEEFNKFWPEHSKISKICTLMGWFWPKYIMFQLKKYRGVMFDCTQDWYKVWRKTGLCFQKLTWGIWQIFTRALENLKNLHFNRLLLTKVYNVWAKKSIEELCLMALKIDAKFEGKLTCAFKNDMRNLANFYQSMFGSLKIGTLMGSYYPKGKMYELKIYWRVLCHDNEE